MSQELLSVEEMDNAEPFDAGLYDAEPNHPDSYEDAAPGAHDALAVRDQALEIIGSVLGHDHKPDTEAAARLRLHVAAHPEEPERALLEHLMETGRINRTDRKLA